MIGTGFSRKSAAGDDLHVIGLNEIVVDGHGGEQYVVFLFDVVGPSERIGAEAKAGRKRGHGDTGDTGAFRKLVLETVHACAHRSVDATAEDGIRSIGEQWYCDDVRRLKSEGLVANEFHLLPEDNRQNN